MPTPSQRNILRDKMAALDGLDAADSRPTTAAPTPIRADHSILTAATDEDLRHAFAANLFDLFRAAAQLPGGELDETATLCRHHAFPFNPMFKGAWQPRLTSDAADTAIAETVAWFQSRGAPFCFWWVDLAAQPADLAQRLVSHGFAPWEEHAPGMAAPLADLRYDLMGRVPAGFVMERVTDEQGLADFKTAFVAGMEIPDWAGQAWVDATLAAGIDASPWRCYVGKLDGRPVASNMLFCGAGVASVFGVATHPDARGQGIGTAITLIAYHDAYQAGYAYGVLFASELGASVYRRMGFRDVGASISRYLWRAG